MAPGNKNNPPPDKSIHKKPEQEPITSPSTGQHQPDLQDERSKKKRSNTPQGREDINPDEFPGNGNSEEYNDGEMRHHNLRRSF